MSCPSSHDKSHCTCTYTACEKRGNCCQCVVYHRTRGEVPGCFFTPEGERSYDRSYERFLSDRKG
jgi:hypothetical protein